MTGTCHEREPRMRSELGAGAGHQMPFASVTSNVVLSLP